RRRSRGRTGRRRTPPSRPTASIPASPPAPAGSYLLRGAGAEQAVGPEQQDQDQDGEDQRLAPLLPGVPAAERPDQADDEPAEDRPGDVPDPAQHRRGERVDAVLEPHL